MKWLYVHVRDDVLIPSLIGLVTLPNLCTVPIEYQKYEDRLEEEWNAAASDEYNTELSDNNPDAYDSDYGSDRSY